MATPSAKSQSSRKDLTASRVRVVLRVRPFLPSEAESKEKNLVPCITLPNKEYHSSEEVTVRLKDQWSSRNECYKLDSFFSQDDRVDRIFHGEVKAVIPGIFCGSNATVFAYGATGSGKTYTMQGTEDEPGLIPLAVSTILAMCEETQSSVEISYYEIYMERCYDLLEPKAKEIMALDDKEGRTQLKGLSWIMVRSMDEFCEAYSTGIQRRKVAHTGLNDVSSRSHAVLSMTVTNGSLKGKLNLIDLAGNEDNRRTCNQGIRLQESAKINQSLFALSNVIYALNNNEPRIPYRESKLTRILQDSLGGTSHALMVACLNPTSYKEAVHTVSLAARSRHVVNYVGSANKQDTPRVKVDMEAKLRAWLESKGKTRSIQRMNGPCSPLVGKSSTSLADTKGSGSIWSSAKETSIDQSVSKAKGRKLFDSGVRFSNSIVRTSPSKLRVTGVQHDVMFDDFLSVLKDESNQGHTMLQDENELEPSENTNVNKDEWHRAQSDAFLNYHSPPPKDEDIQEYIADPVEHSTIEPFSLHISGNDEERSACDVNFSKTMTQPGASSNKENLHYPSVDVGSPATSEKLRELQSSFRKVLSLIPDNVAPNKHPSTDDRICIILLEPKTPKTPYEMDKVQMSGTPVDKFNSLSSNLKESVVQEYLSFLNVASKEELLQLKGIGPKRAEHILHLREKTPKPLKSLSDLEKIGLSSKQVHDMFRRAARGIFT